MKKLFLAVLVASALTSCNGQNNTKSDLAQSDIKPKDEKPKGNWTVNKEVDENGNIVKYDSIYSYSSTGNLKGLSPKYIDSVMNGFTQKFEKHFYSSSNGSMPDVFGDENIFNDDFFNNTFGDDSESVSKMMQKMKEGMEAMQNQMQQGQTVIPAIPQEDNSK